MKRLSKYAASALLLCAFAATAQEKGTWRAMSRTARSITGDVTLAPERITIDFQPFTIAQIRTLTPAEITTLNPDGIPGTGNLYRLSIPAGKKFLGRNTMCGADDTQWMATDLSGKTLELAFFSGESMPVFTPEAFANATNLCGTYAYTR